MRAICQHLLESLLLSLCVVLCSLSQVVTIAAEYRILIGRQKIIEFLVKFIHRHGLTAKCLGFRIKQELFAKDVQDIKFVCA